MLGLDDSHLGGEGRSASAGTGAWSAHLSASRRCPRAGFDLRIASAYRSFERQLALWNGKLCGERPVLDDCDRPVDLAALEPRARVSIVCCAFRPCPAPAAITGARISTCLTPAAVPEGYRLQLSPAEVSGGRPLCAAARLAG
jgi:hypothetical protein